MQRVRPSIVNFDRLFNKEAGAVDTTTRTIVGVGLFALIVIAFLAI
ncbi:MULTISPECIES: hypothetical protein [unclassified Mesorhizobium]|nr:MULTISPECIES: hypothetical protein [unclassified Mesorhizobium]